MQFLTGILIGLAAAWLLARAGLLRSADLRGWGSRLRQWLGLPGQSPPARPPSPAAAEPPALAAPTLAAVDLGEFSRRLHALESAYAPTAANAAHPRELEGLPGFREAADLLKAPGVPLSTVMQYALGVNWALSCAALAALADRPDGAEEVEAVVGHFDKLGPWPMHFALKFFRRSDTHVPVGAVVVGAKEWWSDNVIIPALLREYFTTSQQRGDPVEFGWAGVQPAAIGLIRGFLERLNHPVGNALIAELDNIQRASVDRIFLASFGRFWTEGKNLAVLIEPEHWTEALATAEALSLAAPPRSLLVSGEPRVGKSAFLRLLAMRIECQGWTVFEAGGADLMAGQQWFGQLEGRIQRTIEEVAVSKKLIWYIPDILQIAMSGTHQGQAASILDQILPAVSAGRLVIWTEATPASTARLLRVRPALRSTAEVVRLEPQSQEETEELARALVDRWSTDAGLAIDPACVETAVSSARQYFNAASLPGPVLDLLKLTAGRVSKGGGPGANGLGRIDSHSVIQTLAQLTGLPVSILDNKERVDLAAIRDFFAARVIGQDEAVAAVVERIAMLKAGLNDPSKPIGVFLFAGPTGTGKTELAKTVAEFLFGSDDRLIRLDMSEFQTSESTFKILGSSEAAGDADSLINRVRKQPFSVVLLDEFEKAHGSVWDLFLQVFDDGRLTDSLGHVADFRHCIIILTTNLGATSHRGSGLGFAPADETFSSDQILRAIGQTFRPEFQNRLDKVIVFHPLTRDLMREILKKELSRLLDRRGLKDREWAVEWEASAQEFLLEKGFSPEMGARPLKRAIDQYVIAPLAATIVEKRFPEGDQFVFVRSNGRGIQAEFVDPDTDIPSSQQPGSPLPERLPALPAMILAPVGTAGEVRTLESEYAALTQTLLSAEWEELKMRLAEAMQARDFWSRPDRHQTLSHLALMDRVKAAATTAESLRARLVKGTERAGKSSRELVARLALQIHLIKEGIKDVLESAPVEVALLIEPALEKQGEAQITRDWCGQLLDMYRAWAKNRHMQLGEMAGVARSMPLLVISGFGAHRLLAQEVGLHVLELPDDDKGRSRATARVRLAVAPLGDLSAEKLRAAVLEALERAGQPHAVVRRYRTEPSPLVRNMNGSWRTGRLDAVLGGDFDLIAASQS